LKREIFGVKTTAGVLLYRFRGGAVQVLLVYNGKNWSIPKGSVKRGERPRKAAKRELKEETGLHPPRGLLELGSVRKRTGRQEKLHCFIAEYFAKAKPKGRREIVHAAFMTLANAAVLIEKFQRPLLTSLTAIQALGDPRER